MAQSERLERIYQQEAGRCIATMVRVLGDLDAAEDAVADAFAIAAKRWPVDGFPSNPGGWITTTARNKAIDRHRREVKRHDRHQELHHLEQGDVSVAANLGELDVVDDDQLRLIFLCCHPALGPDAQVALTLRLLGGLETSEIARAFLVPEATMAQRIVRAKRKIRDNHVAYRVPEADALPARLVPVLGTVYLMFSEGHTATAGPDLMRPELTTEALRLGRLLAALLPDEYEVIGLLALMVLTESRRPARMTDSGELITLANQDRGLWDTALVAEGHHLVRACLRHNRPGPYQIQAAIAAVHADAATAETTDWSQVVALYDQLLDIRPQDIVALNRAIAVAELSGPEAGLDALAGVGLEGYHLFHATRGEFLARLGRADDARVALSRAIALADNEAEIRHLTNRLHHLAQLA